MTIKVTKQSGGRRAKSRRTTRVWSLLLEVVLLAIAGLSLLVLLFQDFGLVMKWLYGPVVVIIVVIMFIEYLVIKGGDRSRLYLIEIERMQEREQAHIARTRRALEELARAVEQCPKAATDGEESESTDPAPSELEQSLRRIDKILRPDLKG